MPDLALKNDGVYQGHYQIGPVRVVLDVTIADGVIDNIEIIKHDNGLGEKGGKNCGQYYQGTTFTNRYH
jgi:uncharacterized protein with FMN-binding domain